MLLIIAIVGIVLMYVGIKIYIHSWYMETGIVIFIIGFCFICMVIRQLRGLREDIRGICHKPCLYNDNGKCDMWDETEKCDNQIDV